jgi:hypothetical protein
MSFICTTYCPEGIAMSADSRMTLNSQKQVNPNVKEMMSVTYSNSSQKITVLKDKFGLSFCGDAAIINQPIMGFVIKFEQEILTNEMDIDQIPPLILEYFRNIDENAKIIFHLAGYKSDGNSKVPYFYRIDTKPNKSARNNVDKAGNLKYAATWAGEGEVMAKLFAQPSIVSQKGNQAKTSPPLAILVNFFNLQDAIDFCLFATKLTIDTSNFLPRPRTVGNPIDALIIEPKQGIKWIQKKEYHGDKIK